MQRILRWLLYATIPIAIALQFIHGHLVAEFVFACAAVLPLAAWIGVSTEQLAHRMGSTYGALFNATFGNFAEMVIAIFAIRATARCRTGVVHRIDRRQPSLRGGIVDAGRRLEASHLEIQRA